MALVDKASVMPKPDRVVGLPLTLVHAGVTVTAAPMAVTLPLASTVKGVCAVAELLYVPAVTPLAARVSAIDVVPEPVTSPETAMFWLAVM